MDDHDPDHGDQQDRGGQALTFLFAVLFLALVSPGAALTYGAHRLLCLRSDPLSMWACTLVSSVAIFSGLCIQAGNAARGSLRYFLVALAVSLVVAISAWGFDAQWPLEMWHAFAGR